MLNKEYREHFKNCEGCSLCDHILQDYGGCCVCNDLSHKTNLNYDHPSGNYYCDNCSYQMPEKNTAEYFSCNKCGNRDIVGKIKLYYDYPAGEYYCEECVNDMPEKNTIEYINCHNCGSRHIRKELIFRHENFDGPVCKKIYK